MKFGYARVSTEDQNLDLQVDALKKYGVDEIYQEKVSGTRLEREQLNELLKKLRKEDTLVVWRLDRLGRTVRQLLELSEDFEKKGINLVSINENFDTSTPVGRFTFHMFCAIAQMERDVISERTKAAVAAARSRGRVGGRKRIPEATIKTALKLYDDDKYSIDEIVQMTGISKATLYNYVRQRKKL